jgi:hypothetical protein
LAEHPGSASRGPATLRIRIATVLSSSDGGAAVHRPGTRRPPVTVAGSNRATEPRRDRRYAGARLQRSRHQLLLLHRAPALPGLDSYYALARWLRHTVMRGALHEHETLNGSRRRTIDGQRTGTARPFPLWRLRAARIAAHQSKHLGTVSPSIREWYAPQARLLTI